MGGYTVLREETWDFPLQEPANRYYIYYGDFKFLIDAGARPLQQDRVEGFYIVITHWHWDHTYGLTGLRRGRLCIARDTLDSLKPGRARESMMEVVRAMGYVKDIDSFNMLDLFVARYTSIEEAISKIDVYELEDCPPIRAGVISYIECPGHSRDHKCYIIGNDIFVGDNVIPTSKTVTLTDVTSYNESMIRVLSVTGWMSLYPGHGNPISRDETVEWFINHYKHKERRLMETLTGIAVKGEVTLRSLLHAIYGVKDELSSYIAARTLIGYINALDSMGLVTVDRSKSPWIIRLQRSPRD